MTLLGKDGKQVIISSLVLRHSRRLLDQATAIARDDVGKGAYVRPFRDVIVRVDASVGRVSEKSSSDRLDTTGHGS